MRFQPGNSGNPHGRPRGATSETTLKIRESFRMLFENLLPLVEQWVLTGAMKDPLRAAELVTRFAEFHIPRLQRIAIDLRQLALEEILIEVARREQEIGTQSAPAQLQ